MLSAGTRLGPYEIVGPLGAGGMGEVYRATDTNLKRLVAIKVLPPSLSDVSDRLARFQREAEVLAALNHPNIAQIYGVEKSDGALALVMELVDGPTLADRIVQGALALEEALSVAKQIADALEAAHERGIIHRDLKPANIKLRPDGTVKVLDFGLAKAMEPTAVSAAGSLAPTITTPAMTQQGVILGTAAYMSPEQARGRTLDQRADIWAFGCVLFEMLAGRRPFGGDEVPDVLANVLAREPEWSALPPGTPTAVRRVIARCLTKELRKRLHHVADARLELLDALAVSYAHDVTSESGRPLAQEALAERRPVRTMTAIGVLAAVVGLAGGWMLNAALTSRVATSATAAPELRLEISTPPTTDPVSFAISPDGRQIVYIATFEMRSVLWVRPLDSTRARPLSGTDEASFPFWSPDNRSVGFFDSDQLKRIDLETGAVQALAPVNGARGGAWLSDGTILYTAAPGNAPILRVPATGGTPVAVVKQGRFPQLLPDGRHFVYMVPQAFTPADRGIWVAALDGSGAHRLTDADSAAVVAPSATCCSSGRGRSSLRHSIPRL